MSSISALTPTNSLSVKKIAAAQQAQQPSALSKVSQAVQTPATSTPGGASSASIGSTINSMAQGNIPGSSQPAAAPTKLSTATPTMSTTAAQSTPAASSVSGSPTAAQKVVAQTQAGMAKSGATPATPNPVDQLGSQFQDPTGYFSQANSAIDKQEQTAQQLGQDQIAANQRRAATLSALSGRGLGGGFAQALTQGTIDAQNNMQQQINQMESQRQAIYGTEASQAFQNQQQNKQNAFQMQQTAAQNAAAAAAQAGGATAQNAINAASTALQHMDMDPTGATRAAGSTVAKYMNAVNSAPPGSPQQTAAINALNGFVAKLNQLKAQNPKAKGGDWQNIVNQAEQRGYFNDGATLPAPTAQAPAQSSATTWAY